MATETSYVKQQNDWTVERGPNAGKVVRLLTPAQLAAQPKGTRLLAIDGDELVVGRDHFDDDTRFGYTAFGHVVAPTPSSEASDAD